MASFENKPKNNEQKDIPKLQASNFAAGAETKGPNGNDGGDKFRGNLEGASFSSDLSSFRADLSRRQSTAEHQESAKQFTT